MSRLLRRLAWWYILRGRVEFPGVVDMSAVFDAEEFGDYYVEHYARPKA